MMNTGIVGGSIYGLSLHGAGALYIGWSRHDGELNRSSVISELATTKDAVIKDWISKKSNQDIDFFEIEPLSSELDIAEALDFWRNYFRSLGVRLATDS
jgi:hypothetical protein